MIVVKMFIRMTFDVMKVLIESTGEGTLKQTSILCLANQEKFSVIPSELYYVCGVRTSVIWLLEKYSQICGKMKEL